MLITDDFVYIHMPKTGGTFVTEVINRLHTTRAERWLSAYLPGKILKRIPNRILARMKKNLINENKHGVCREIPESYRDRPILATVRNPYDRWVSQYEFKWWMRYPPPWWNEYPRDLKEIQRMYPHFPDLSFEEYLGMWNFIVSKELKSLGIDGDEGFGVQTWQFVEFFFKDPQAILPMLDEDYIASQRYKSDMFDKICFIKTGQLNQELYDFLLNVGYTKLVFNTYKHWV